MYYTSLISGATPTQNPQLDRRSHLSHVSKPILEITSFMDFNNSAAFTKDCFLADSGQPRWVAPAFLIDRNVLGSRRLSYNVTCAKFYLAILQHDDRR